MAEGGIHPSIVGCIQPCRQNCHCFSQIFFNEINNVLNRFPWIKSLFPTRIYYMGDDRYLSPHLEELEIKKGTERIRLAQEPFFYTHGGAPLLRFVWNQVIIFNKHIDSADRTIILRPA